MKTKYKKLKESTEKERTFPCFLKSKDSNLVVLFFSSTAGIVMEEGEGFNKNEFYHTWLYTTNTNMWQEIKASVVFTSE